MTKTYKHKKLWWIAELDWDNKAHWYRIWKVEWNIKLGYWNSTDYSKDWRIIERYSMIDSQLIENSDDWEEIKEEDWIEKVFIEYVPVNKYSLRNAIEKHMPKVTEEEIKKIMIGSCNSQLIQKEELIDLLKSKWLYKE